MCVCECEWCAFLKCKIVGTFHQLERNSCSLLLVAVRRRWCTCIVCVRVCINMVFNFLCQWNEIAEWKIKTCVKHPKERARECEQQINGADLLWAMAMRRKVSMAENHIAEMWLIKYFLVNLNLIRYSRWINFIDLFAWLAISVRFHSIRCATRLHAHWFLHIHLALFDRDSNFVCAAACNSSNYAILGGWAVLCMLENLLLVRSFSSCLGAAVLWLLLFYCIDFRYATDFVCEFIRSFSL